jgi:hypothetical protein
MFNNRRITLSVLVLCISAIACNVPSGAPTTETPSVTFTPVTLTETSTSTFTPVAEACKPAVTTNTDANVRNGPGTVYGIVGVLPQGGTATPAGKNSEGTWWYIEFPAGNGGYAWIAGSVTTAVCIPNTLAIIAAPPTPIQPTITFTNTPTQTATITNTPGIFFPIVTLILLPFGDINLQDVFLSTDGEIVARIATSGTISGSFKYRVYVEGNLKVTKTDTLPVGSQVYYSGQIILPDIFDQNKTVKVIVDPTDEHNETDEGNNQLTVSCNSITKDC